MFLNDKSASLVIYKLKCGEIIYYVKESVNVSRNLIGSIIKEYKEQLNNKEIDEIRDTADNLLKSFGINADIKVEEVE